MNTPVRGLVVEDDPRHADLLKKRLLREFDPRQWTVDIEVRHDPDAAQDTIRETAPFDFAIVDFHLGEGRPNAPVVIEELRRRSVATFILVITADPTTHIDYIRRSYQYMADHAMHRGELVGDPSEEWSMRGVANKIKQWVLLQNRVEGFRVEFDLTSLGMRSTLHVVGGPGDEGTDPERRGEQIAQHLIISCLEPGSQADKTTLTVRHLTAGRSGAHVCRVDRTGSGPLRSFFVKIGLDRRALKYERQQNEQAREILADTALIALKGSVQTHHDSGYCAVVADLASQAITLGAWLREYAHGDLPERTREQIEAVCDILFSEHLAPLFQANLRDRRPIAEWLPVSAIVQTRTEATLTKYREIWLSGKGAHRGDAPYLAEVIRSFLASGELPSGGKIPPTHETVFLGGFGDLHAANVLVNQGVHQTPVLVDASAFGPQHWSGDAARLLVDLVLGVRHADVRAMLWDDYDDSCAYALGLCPDANVAAAAEDADGVDIFIARVLARLKEYLHFDELDLPAAHWHWQWHAALGREFARRSGSDLPAPRAVLALTAAAEHLTRAGKLFEHKEDQPSLCARRADG